jgi:hypothetical protein
LEVSPSAPKVDTAATNLNYSGAQVNNIIVGVVDPVTDKAPNRVPIMGMNRGGPLKNVGGKTYTGNPVIDKMVEQRVISNSYWSGVFNDDYATGET